MFTCLDGYAPFLSMATRDTFLTVKESKIAAPGPGTYNPKIYDFIPGGSTLVNQSVRFHEKHSDTPGPGCYSLSKESDWLKNKKSQSFDDNFLRHVSLLANYSFLYCVIYCGYTFFLKKFIRIDVNFNIWTVNSFAFLLFIGCI